MLNLSFEKHVDTLKFEMFWPSEKLCTTLLKFSQVLDSVMDGYSVADGKFAREKIQWGDNKGPVNLWKGSKELTKKGQGRREERREWKMREGWGREKAVSIMSYLSSAPIWIFQQDFDLSPYLKRFEALNFGSAGREKEKKSPIPLPFHVCVCVCLYVSAFTGCFCPQINLGQSKVTDWVYPLLWFLRCFASVLFYWSRLCIAILYERNLQTNLRDKIRPRLV